MVCSVFGVEEQVNQADWYKLRADASFEAASP